jgi:hypothetical protein
LKWVQDPAPEPIEGLLTVGHEKAQIPGQWNWDEHRLYSYVYGDNKFFFSAQSNKWCRGGKFRSWQENDPDVFDVPANLTLEEKLRYILVIAKLTE